MTKEELEINKLEACRADAIEAARELYYSFEVLDKLKKAKTEGEISRIMVDGRKEKFG